MIFQSSWLLPNDLTPERYQAGMILELSVAIISILFWGLMVTKFFQKRTKILGLLTTSYLGFLLTLLSTLIEKILVITGVRTYPEIVYGVKIGVFAGLGALAFLFFYAWFVYYAFLENIKPWAKKVLRIIQVLSILLAIYAIILFIVPTTDENYQFYFLPISVLSILLLAPLLITASNSFYQIMTKSGHPKTGEEKLRHLSVRSLLINAIVLLGYVILYGIDVAVPQLAMSVFYFIAWGLVGVSFIFGYVGYFQPKWLVKRYQKKDMN
ncbi:hypothetical protein NEF87_003967 [Candidatus Lokiarchaeum ossiferum]|uniref:Uncharacterized protein n=1 Tax=Candidatus Lokiarchaeum ossiferum TaxID=2951803 RepID=A0ABY6HXU4_9ARCH|nr:hypothetical protein NEF87_003967 [Candidatus Lokiarchaeum sp. B-35]